MKSKLDGFLSRAANREVDIFSLDLARDIREGVLCSFTFGFISGRNDQSVDTKAHEFGAAVETEPRVGLGNDGRLSFEIDIGRGHGRWSYSKLSPEKVKLAGLFCK